MVTKIEICNMALSYVGARSSIEQLTDPTTEAQQCALWYDTARREVLDQEAWDFAMRRVALSAHSSPPPSQWRHRYAYPEDCILFLRIEHANDEYEPRFEMDTVAGDGASSRSIVTNEDNAVGIYVRDEENPAVFDPSFVNALSWCLAEKIAYNISGDGETAGIARAGYARALRRQLNEDGTISPREEALENRPRPLDRTDYGTTEAESIRVANMALAILGRPASVNSFEDTTQEARQAAFWFDHCRRTMYETSQGGFPFATKRADLVVHDEPPPQESGWSFRYVYPSDCVRIQSMGYQVAGGDAQEVPYYSVETASDGRKSILTDVGEATLVYSIDERDMTKAPDTFKEALASFMAREMAPAFLSSVNEINFVNQVYLFNMSRAQGSIETFNYNRVNATWVAAR